MNRSPLFSGRITRHMSIYCRRFPGEGTIRVFPPPGVDGENNLVLEGFGLLDLADETFSLFVCSFGREYGDVSAPPSVGLRI